MWTSKSFVCKTLKLLKDLSLKPSLGYAVIFFHHSSLSQLGYHKYLVDHQTNNAYRWKKEVPTLCKWAPKKTVFEIFLPFDTKIWFAYSWTGGKKIVIVFTMKSEMRTEEYHGILLHVIIKRRVLIKMTKHRNIWHFINHTIFTISSSWSESCFENKEHLKWSHNLICILQQSYFSQNSTRC